MAMSPRIILLVAVGVTLPICVTLFVRREHRRSDVARAAVTAVAPGLAKAIDREITRLEGESIDESLAELSDVNAFNLGAAAFSGSGSFAKEWIPLSKDVGLSDLQAIMGNRRFCKAFEELSRMDKSTASLMVNRQLSAAIDEYSKLYETELRRWSTHFKLENLEGRSGFSGPTFTIDNVRDGKVVIAGSRLKVLALVWIAGMLELTGCKDQIERVASLAIKQRTELYEDSTLHAFFKSQMLQHASLYNRQIIGSGLLGVAENDQVQSRALNAASATWLERDLTSYASAATELDAIALSGAIQADYSKGRWTVKFLSQLSDSSFDALIERLSTEVR